jgi:hypothetical protein
MTTYLNLPRRMVIVLALLAALAVWHLRHVAQKPRHATELHRAFEALERNR